MIQKYDLRCVFEYINKPTWRSQWNRTGENKIDSAAWQTKEGLLFAVVEGKDIRTREIIRLAECPGHNFCNFQWIAATALPLGGGAATITKIIGLCLVTIDQNVFVLKDGCIQLENRDKNEDKFMHYGRN